MPFAVKPLVEVSRWLRGVAESVIPGARVSIWPNNLTIITKIIAMAAHEGDLRAEYLWRQIWVRSAEGLYLDLHGYQIGLARKPATPATGTVTFPATTGTTVPVGVRLVADTGSFYITTASATASGSSITLSVEAEVSGASGNAPAGLVLRLVEPQSGVETSGAVDVAGLGSGTDQETDEPYRSRILDLRRRRPRGGNDDDYVIWVKQIWGGYARAFIKQWGAGAGTVSIYPLKPGSGVDAIPTLSDLNGLAVSIEKLRPSTATVVLGQAAVRTINVTITNLQQDTVDVRSEIVSELLDMFDERAVVALPGEVTLFDRSWIGEAISRAAGEDSHTLTSPSANITLNPGEYPVLGTVSFA